MYLPSWSFALLVTTAVNTPPSNKKRYDLDGNGIPDWCWSDGTSAHCMRSDGSWTAVPATEGRTSTSVTTTLSSSTKTSTSTSTKTAVVTTQLITSTTAKTTTSIMSSKPTTSSKTTSSAASTTSSAKSSIGMTGKIPSPSQFAADKNSKWSIKYQGDVKYTGALANQGVGADKGRTGKIGNKVIWNFGDMECQGNWQICGFSMGPAFYGTDDVMTVNTTGVSSVQNNDFVQAWSGDPTPVAPQWAWGMDTSNVASINDTHGVAFAWEIWRGASDGSSVDRGNAVASITLGDDKPIANRVGPLLTGPDKIQLGLLAILRDGDFVYTYSIGGPSNLIVGRVPASDAVFDPNQHSFLAHSSSNTPQWISGIPSSSTTTVGATTANPSGQFGCSVYGSVFFNTYLQKYTIVCNIFMNYVNMYTSDTPWGPWSAEYSLMNGQNEPKIQGSYGSMVHAEYGSGKEVYLSLGPNSQFFMYKLDLSGY